MSTAIDAAAPSEQLADQLTYLKLLFLREHYAALTRQAAEEHWGITSSSLPTSSTARYSGARSAACNGVSVRHVLR